MNRIRKVALVAGARPNFMKIAPIYRALKKRKRFKVFFVHTGQHYDWSMSQSHVKDLGLPKPDVDLGIGSGSQAGQTAKALVALEEAFLKLRPDWVVVVGDVNSTLAAAIAAKKLHIQVAHVEAGLRSFDRSMPEEINRIATDAVSDLLFTHSQEAGGQLRKEGVQKRAIHFVGNVMIDSLFYAAASVKDARKLSTEPYVLVTLHRPSNVDDVGRLKRIMKVLETISSDILLFFPVHPRTKNMLRHVSPPGPRVRLIAPLPYRTFVQAMSCAKLVVTDSGGVQEETTALGVPCLTLRKNTERPITVTRGTNRIVGENPEKLIPLVKQLLRSKKRSRTPRIPLWDGKASERIARLLEAS